MIPIRGLRAPVQVKHADVPKPLRHFVPHFGTTTWSTEKCELLIRLWERDLSTEAIANTMGLSRNAVVGKMYRLGLPRRDHRVGHPRA
jgi:hypothetical protein